MFGWTKYARVVLRVHNTSVFKKGAYPFLNKPLLRNWGLILRVYLLLQAPLHHCHLATWTFPAITSYASHSFSKAENALNRSPLQEDLKEKRKRESQSTERESKRLRFTPMREGAVSVDHCCISAQDVQENIVLTATKQPTSNKLSRTHRLRRQSGTPASLPHNSEPSSGFINITASCSQSLKTSDSFQRGKLLLCWLFFLPVMWFCDIYIKMNLNFFPFLLSSFQFWGCSLDRQIQSSAFKWGHRQLCLCE